VSSALWRRSALKWSVSAEATTSLRHPDSRGTSVPVHRNQEVRVGTLRGILRDCKLTADEFLNLLD
jgi:hypothetical protein